MRRVDAAGALVTLEEQDRSLWDREQIAEGLRYVETALRRTGSARISCRRRLPRYMPRPGAPARPTGRRLPRFTASSRINPTPVVQLNGAVAIGMSEGPGRGLALVDPLGASGDSSDTTSFTPPALTCCAGSAGSDAAGRTPDRRALALMANGVERAYLEHRLAAL